MSDADGFFAVLLTGLVIGFSIGTMVNALSERENITSRKEFIIGKASYKCTKTNELRGGE